MEVTGRVSIGRGHAYIHLAPVRSQQTWQPRPTREQVQHRILEGQLTVHESRLPLTRPALNSMLDYIQVQLNLPRGINGGWSEQADDRLANMLGKQKRGSAARPMPLALLDAPAGTCPEQAPQPGSAKDSSSSESPEAGSAKDSSSSESEEGSRKRKQS